MISIANLKLRAQTLARARSFFSEREILEVDCPILGQGAPLDPFISIFSLEDTEGKKRFLHSSPEYGMKRLLSGGAPDIYQISHVFRKEESGSRHNPEFTMVEWYRLGFSYEQMITDTLDFLKSLLSNHSVERYSYTEAFLKFAGLTKLSKEILLEKLSEKEAISQNISLEELIPYAFSRLVESNFNKKAFTVIYDFPKEQAALSQVEGPYAKRFEIFFEGYELANGYLELRSLEEHKKRFEIHSQKDLTIDIRFLEAIEKGLPQCSGVAVGFDRIVMLLAQTNDIRDVLPLSWEEA